MTNQFLQTTCTILIVFFGAMGGTNAQNSGNMTVQTEVTTVELTSFHLVAGADESRFVEAARQMQETFLNHQDGFIKRTLVKGEQGWTDIVYWKDPQSMQNAMEKAETSAEVAPFIQMIDFQSVKMHLSEIKLKTNE
jgi:hypothetical protein